MTLIDTKKPKKHHKCKVLKNTSVKFFKILKKYVKYLLICKKHTYRVTLHKIVKNINKDIKKEHMFICPISINNIQFI